MKKSREDLAGGWVLKAQSDLADARRTVASEGPYDTACFHCQQAAEKYLKAFLAWNGADIPRTHDVEELLLLCSKIDPVFSALDIVPEQLTAYAVEMRYDAEFWPDLRWQRKHSSRLRRLKLQFMGPCWQPFGRRIEDRRGPRPTGLRRARQFGRRQSSIYFNTFA